MSRKKPVKIEIGKTIRVEPDGVYESKVVKSGNGAVINFFKKFIGDDVVVLVSDKIKNKKYKKEKEKQEDKEIAEKWYDNTFVILQGL